MAAYDRKNRKRGEPDHDDDNRQKEYDEEGSFEGEYLDEVNQLVTPDNQDYDEQRPQRIG